MKFFALSSLAGAGLLLFALLSPQTIVEKHAAVLKEAQSLKVVYTFQHLPGARAEYTLTYSRPNFVLMDGPDRLIQSDGKTLYEYNKSAKSYTETPVSGEMLGKKAQADEVLAWAPFFASDMLKSMSNFQGGTQRVIKGAAVTEVTFTLAGSTPRTVTLYVDDKLGIARGMSMKSATGDVLAMATTIELGKEPLPADKFAFVAPAGSTKIVAPSVDVNGTSYASVQGIFQNNCLGCHGGRGSKGGFSVASYKDVMNGGRSGPAVIAGDPDNSSLVKYLTGEKQPRMPQGKAALPSGDIAKIKDWIKDGAKE
jgi:outer membrane lipoprotein-sorting protein